MSQIAEAPAIYQAAKKPSPIGVSILPESQWQALRLASVRGVSDSVLAKEFGVEGGTIRKKRSRDPVWQAAVQSRRGVTVSRSVTNPPQKPETPPEKRVEAVVTQSLDQIGTENNLLAAQFAHASMQESVKSGLIAAPSTWQEFSTAHKMVRTATGQDKEGTSVNLSLWGAGAVAIAGAQDPFETAFDITPQHETESREDWI